MIEAEARQRLERLAKDAVDRVREQGGPVEGGIAFHDTEKDELFTTLDSFEAAREAVLSLPHFEERFGASESLRVTIQFVLHFLDRLWEGIFNDPTFEQIWSDLNADVAEPEWTYLGLSNLQNFHTTQDPVDFGDGITIRGRSHADLADMGFNQGVLDAMDADWLQGWGFGPFVLLVEDRIAKEPGNVVLGNAPDLWAKTGRILSALRLSAEGDVGISRMWLHRVGRFPLGGGGLTATTSDAVTATVGALYHLTDAVAGEARTTYSALRQLEQTDYRGGPGNLDLAINTFASSFSHRPFSPQRLVDLITTLEALIGGTGSGEIAFRLAFRVAGLLGASDAERAAIFTEVKAYYDTRSRVVHGQQLRPKHHEHLTNNGPLRTYVRRLLRAAIHLRTEGGGSYSKRFFDEELEATLLDDATRAPLLSAMGLGPEP